MVVGSIYGYTILRSYPVVYRALALVPVAALAVYVAVLTTQAAHFFLCCVSLWLRRVALYGLPRQEAVQKQL